ncbi:MAG: hypothetical protein Q9185_006187 [Variospora sp. 1 TL-2023]
MSTTHNLILILLLLPLNLHAQSQALAPQTDTFNSSFALTPDQQSQYNIDPILANNVAVALNFERSNFAHGPPSTDDAFYILPSNTATSFTAPGTLLKLQVAANTSAYTLPPNTALSRFIFQSFNPLKNNGTHVPVSASILWPYLPRTRPDGTFPVVVWAHGATGVTGNCAPSAYRNQVYQFATIFALVQAGYVVVAPDYVGLGVTGTCSTTTTTTDRGGGGKKEEIVHPYLGSQSHAEDLFYSVQAAREAFPTLLSEKFVVVGHSQGGRAAWAAGVRQARKPVKGYLGAVVGSPLTDLLRFPEATDGGLAAFLARTFESLYPGGGGFEAEDILTEDGVKRLRLMEEIKGCFSLANVLLVEEGLARDDWKSNTRVQNWNTTTNPAGRPIEGPMLVIQGESDPIVPAPVTAAAVCDTCAKYPGSRLRYATFQGATHVPVMFASQRLWLDWIGERFEGREIDEGCRTDQYSSARPLEYYQAEQTWFLLFAKQAYQTA